MYVSVFIHTVFLVTIVVSASPNFQFGVNGQGFPLNLEQVWERYGFWSIPTARSDNVSPQCKEDSLYYAESLASFSSWAVRMYDASGKMPDGFASGNIHAMGHFDQCINIQLQPFSGQYCTVFLKPMTLDKNQAFSKSFLSYLEILNELGEKADAINVTSFYAPFTPSIAFCLPSTCSALDVELAVIDAIGKNAFYGHQVGITTGDSYCLTAQSGSKIDVGTIVMIVVLAIIAFLLIIGTIYDAFRKEGSENLQPSLWSQMLLCFSLHKNASRIFNTQSANKSLCCLHGIRFLSTSWVVMGHSWSENTQEFSANWPTLLQAGYSFPMQAISNGLVSVDTFFFLSGLLVAYNALKEFEKNRKLNPFLFYAHRYLRLTPVYAVILGFIATIVVHLNNGPMWSSIEYQTQECRRTWWSNLLYINNFIGPGYTMNFCMGETWYLACDFQLFLLAPFLIYPIWRSPKKGFLILGLLTAFSIIASMTQTGLEHLPPTILSTRMDISAATLRYEVDYYTKVWPRLAPYAVGMAMGWALHKYGNSKVEMKPAVVTAGWCISTSTALAILYGLYGYADARKAPYISQYVSIAYSGLHKLGWSMSLSWLVWACANGYGGFVNTFLSSKVFIPLGRLTYCAYLIHLNWMTFYYARSRVPMYYTTTDQVFLYAGHLTISMCFAFIASICVEAPFLNLEKMLFTPRR